MICYGNTYRRIIQRHNSDEVMSSETKNRNGSQTQALIVRDWIRRSCSRGIRFWWPVCSLERKVSATAPGGSTLGWRTADKVSHDGLGWLEAACGATSRLIACIFYVEVCTCVYTSHFFVGQSGQLEVKGFTRVICFRYYTQQGQGLLWQFSPAGRHRNNIKKYKSIFKSFQAPYWGIWQPGSQATTMPFVVSPDSSVLQISDVHPRISCVVSFVWYTVRIC